MAAGNVKELDRSRAESAEVARLRRELEQARARLQEETTYYQGELEAARQRVEKEHIRAQAEELAKRRRAEELLEVVKLDLQATQLELERARARYETLAQRLDHVEESGRRHTQQEVDKVRAAAKAAWKSAEDELARVEEELAETRRLLQRERERARQFQETMERLRAERATLWRPDQDSLKLVASLKKALWATAQARRKAEMELVRLREAPPPTEADTIKQIYRAAQEPLERESRWESGLYNELDSERLKSLNLGEAGHELCEDFLVMPADASLDRETFARLQALPELSDLEPVRADPPRTEAPAAQPPRPAPLPAEAAPAVDTPRVLVIDGRLLKRLAAGGAGAIALVWLVSSGALRDLLGALVRLL